MVIKFCKSSLGSHICDPGFETRKRVEEGLNIALAVERDV